MSLLLHQLVDALCIECKRIQNENDNLRAEVCWLKSGLENHQQPLPNKNTIGEQLADSNIDSGCVEDETANVELSISLKKANDEFIAKMEQETDPSADDSTPASLIIPHKMWESIGLRTIEPPSCVLDDAEEPANEVKFSIRNLVKANYFEMVYCVLIFLNFTCLAMNAQYEGMDIGHDLGVAGYPNTARDTWSGAKQVFAVMDFFFGSMFILEIVLKVYGLRLEFGNSLWNIIDTVIVACWIALQTGVAIKVNPTMLRLLRLVRLARLVKLMSTLEAFDSLRVIVLSISASFSILMWSSALLLVLEAMVGLFLQSMLMGYMEDRSNTDLQRIDAFLYFGTFSRTIITMNELTFGNFVPVVRFMSDNVGELYGYALILYKLSVGFAIIRIISGVFLHETFKTANADDELMIVQRKRGIETHLQKMVRLVEMADESRDGSIDRHEFERFLNDERMRAWLAAQDVDTGNPTYLFDLLDLDADEQLTPAEICNGMARIKGTAKSSDLLGLIHLTTDLLRMVEKIYLKVYNEPSHRTPRRGKTSQEETMDI